VSVSELYQLVDFTRTYPEQGWGIEAAERLAAVGPLTALLVRSGRDCDGVLYGVDFMLVDSFRLLKSSGRSGGGSIDAGPASYLVGDGGTVDGQGLNVKAVGNRARQGAKSSNCSGQLLVLGHHQGNARADIALVGTEVLYRCQGLLTAGSFIAYLWVKTWHRIVLYDDSACLGLLVVGDAVLHVQRGSNARALRVSGGGRGGG
jgi:hypothetical protein